jgi:hypothetical protein
VSEPGLDLKRWTAAWLDAIGGYASRLWASSGRKLKP